MSIKVLSDANKKNPTCTTVSISSSIRSVVNAEISSLKQPYK